MSMIPLLLLAVAGEGQGPGQDAFFESRVRPVLVEHCQKCHGAAKQQASLRLDSAAAIGQSTWFAATPARSSDARMAAAPSSGAHNGVNSP